MSPFSASVPIFGIDEEYVHAGMNAYRLVAMLQTLRVSRVSTGDAKPRDLGEQTAMQQAMANPGAGEPILRIKDSRWPASEGWVKMSQNINGIEIHYNMNTTTGDIADIKFKR